jgi:hypothetical protein
VEFDDRALRKELQALCKGSAARKSTPRLGPQLRRVCGITDRHQVGQIRQLLQETVQRLLDESAEQTTLFAAFALLPELKADTLGGRLRKLAKDLHVSVRTLERHRELAIDAFVAAAAAEARTTAQAGDVGYVVDDFDGTLDLTGGLAKFIERRKIRMTQRSDVVNCLCRPPKPEGTEGLGVKIVLVSGGVGIKSIHRAGGGTVGYSVQLPRTLERGEVHEFEVAKELPLGHPVDPHYVIKPMTPFEACSIGVVFDPGAQPARVWRVDGTPPMEVDVPPPDNELLVIDPSGRVRVSFRVIAQGRAYGIAWEPPPGAATT